MASQALLNQFWQALERSKSFQSLTPFEQAEIKSSYANVSDEQIRLALEEIAKDDAEISKLEEENAKLAEEQMEATHVLKDTMRKITQEEIQENNSVDKAESEKAAEEALRELG